MNTTDPFATEADMEEKEEELRRNQGIFSRSASVSSDIGRFSESETTQQKPTQAPFAISPTAPDAPSSSVLTAADHYYTLAAEYNAARAYAEPQLYTSATAVLPTAASDNFVPASVAPAAVAQAPVSPAPAELVSVVNEFPASAPAAAPRLATKSSQTATQIEIPVVTQQPQAHGRRKEIPNGLECLERLDLISVHQKVELVPVRQNDDKHVTAKLRLLIKSPTGEELLYAHEESAGFMNKYCGADRGFDIHVEDPSGAVVMQMKRYFKFCGGCCWMAKCDLCAYSFDVEAPPGRLIGHVQQHGTWWFPCYNVYDTEGVPTYKIKGPCLRLPHCMGYNCSKLSFGIYTTHLKPRLVGSIGRQWSGLNEEVVRGTKMLSTTSFAVTFPLEMDVKMKASMLCALFFFDILYFDSERRKMLNCCGNRMIHQDPNSSTTPAGAKPSIYSSWSQGFEGNEKQ